MLSPTNFLESVVGFNVSLSEVESQSGVSQQSVSSQLVSSQLVSSQLVSSQSGVNQESARRYLQLPLQQWGANNVYLLALSS